MVFPILLLFIMKLTFPEYYKTFRCIASDCPDSCCKEWAVDVDDEAATIYRSLPGDLGDRLRSVLRDTEDGTVMEIENGRCPMWRQDGLCQIQAELGHDALCKTCREFPRLRHDYGDFVELGLELSCPEAARLILCHSGDYITETTPKEIAPEYDQGVMEILLKSRNEAIDLLNSNSLPHALAAILLYGHDVQAQIDGDETPASPADCLAEVQALNCHGDMESIFSFFRELEILTESWKIRLQQKPVDIAWTPTLRALAQYMIQRYWLQAISDYDLVCRVKFMIIACLLVGALGRDPIQTAQLFSKEIENDPDNVEAILNGAYTAAPFTDANILGLLLS